MLNQTEEEMKIYAQGGWTLGRWIGENSLSEEVEESEMEGTALVNSSTHR